MQSTMGLGSAGASARAAALRPQTTSAMLVTGASGSGKTSLVNALSAKVSPQLIANMTIDCTPLADERLSALRGTFDQWLAVAAWHSPTLLVLENLETQEVRGTCQIFTQVGQRWPFYSYRIGTVTKHSQALDRTFRAEILSLVKDESLPMHNISSLALTARSESFECICNY